MYKKGGAVKMKPNIGFLNAFIRLVLGFTMFSFAIARLSRRPSCTKNQLFAFFSAKTIAEGLMRYCPVTAWIKSSSTSTQEKAEGSDSDEAFQLMTDFIKTVASPKTDEATSGNQDVNI